MSTMFGRGPQHRFLSGFLLAWEGRVARQLCNGKKLWVSQIPMGKMGSVRQKDKSSKAASIRSARPTDYNLFNIGSACKKAKKKTIYSHWNFPPWPIAFISVPAILSSRLTNSSYRSSFTITLAAMVVTTFTPTGRLASKSRVSTNSL